MPKSKQMAIKAYRNSTFINSPQARILRILSEFIEPMDRFRSENIQDTIVVFGSARVMSKSSAQSNVAKCRRTIEKSKRSGPQSKSLLQNAMVDVEMSHYYEDAVKLTYLLTKWSMKLRPHREFLVCSGGGPGIMEAANKGAMKAGGRSVGLNISLPFEQGSNRFVTPELAFEFHYFFMRKFWFVYPAKALVMFPGGFGTLDELMEVLTLIQTKKIKKQMPIVLYGRKYWNSIINFDEMVRHRTISEQDLRLFKFADTPEEAFGYLTNNLVKLTRQS